MSQQQLLLLLLLLVIIEISTVKHDLLAVVVLCIVPYWGVICIGVAALLIILACCGCLIRMCWKRRKDKQFKKGVKGAVDMKSVQMLTSAMKEKVCDGRGVYPKGVGRAISHIF